MNKFPTLKTAAVMQYPAEKCTAFSTRVHRFLDGSEQRFREFEKPLRRWVIRLDSLETQEWVAVEGFFVSMQGRTGSFSFTDPWDGTDYPNCSLEDDRVEMQITGDDSARISVVIREDLV
jgi:hypothetical protein